MVEVSAFGNLEVVFTQEEIRARVNELAIKIDATYGQEPLVAICVLKGAFIFFSDLVRYLHNKNLELDFVRLSSYGKSAKSSGHIIFNKDIETDIRGKHVLIVEDIVDSGHTMLFLQNQLLAREPASLRIATLVDKHERREADVTVDFACFSMEKGFIVGYGLDFAEHYRTLPFICEIKEERMEQSK